MMCLSMVVVLYWAPYNVPQMANAQATLIPAYYIGRTYL